MPLTIQNILNAIEAQEPGSTARKTINVYTVAPKTAKKHLVVSWSNKRTHGALRPTRIRRYTVNKPMRHKRSANTRTKRLRPNLKAYLTERKVPRKPERRRPVEDEEEENQGPETEENEEGDKNNN